MSEAACGSMFPGKDKPRYCNLEPGHEGSHSDGFREWNEVGIEKALHKRLLESLRK